MISDTHKDSCAVSYKHVEDSVLRFTMLILQPRLLDSCSVLLNPTALVPPTGRGSAAWFPFSTKHIDLLNNYSRIMKHNQPGLQQLVAKKGKRRKKWSLTSRSNSRGSQALSNCISDALLSHSTCPILLSHRLAASQQSEQSRE